MGKNPRVRIDRSCATGGAAAWAIRSLGSGDGSVKGFCARRQFSNVITYRTKEGQQRWFKFGHHGVWTPSQAREGAPDKVRC